MSPQDQEDNLYLLRHITFNKDSNACMVVLEDILYMSVAMAIWRV